jgi:hypothetical protein
MTVEYTVQTAIFYNAAMSAVMAVLNRTMDTSHTPALVALIIGPFVFFVGAIFVADSIRPVPLGVVNKSIYVFIIASVGLGIVFKVLSNQLVVNVTDCRLDS